MNLNNISLPYPVLGISDDIVPLLPEDAVTVDNEGSDKRSYIFNIKLKFANDDIQRLVEQDFAEFSCEYECARTMLRRCVKSKTPEFEITISRRDIYGRLNFNCFVSVKKEIKSYKNKGFNPDYEGCSFDMEPGDILVAFPQFHYDSDISYDKLQAAGSFMQIRENDSVQDAFFDISGDKIEIQLPKQLYDLYCNPYVKGSKEIIHASLVTNALTYALLNIPAENQDDGRLWVRTIYYRLENEEGFSINELDDKNNIPLLAQKLLKSPYLRLFNHIIINSNSTSEE